jgi:hypothetical protein
MVEGRSRRSESVAQSLQRFDPQWKLVEGLSENPPGDSATLSPTGMLDWSLADPPSGQQCQELSFWDITNFFMLHHDFLILLFI